VTGPEHYAEAERLLEQAFEPENAPAMTTILEAQVHATLALAAATANPPGHPREWAEATQ